MNKTLFLLAFTNVLTASVGFSAWSAMRSFAVAHEGGVADLFQNGQERLSFLLVSHGDDEDEDEDDDEDDDDDRHRGGSRDEVNDRDERQGGVSPQPAETPAPPKNGLFGNGTAPQVQVN